MYVLPSLLSLSLDNEVCREVLAKLIADIRKVDIYQSAVIYVYIEANYGGWSSAAEVSKCVRKRPFGVVKTPSYDPQGKNRPGFWTGANEKYFFMQCMKNGLSKQSLRYAEDMVGTNPKTDIEELEKQILYFHRDPKPIKDPIHGKPTYTYTGKGPGKKDDLCLGLQMALYFSQCMMESPEYRQDLNLA